MVADELSTTINRKLMDSPKIIQLGGCLVGQAGDAFFMKEVVDLAKAAKTPDEVYHYLNHGAKELYKMQKEDILQKKFGISLLEFQTGLKRNEDGPSLPLSVNVLAEAEGELEEINESMCGSFLVTSIENGRFEISVVSTEGRSHQRLSTTFFQIGTGSDLAHAKLTDYVSELDTDKRDKIDPSVGLVKLIEAEIASDKMNIGVGGIIQIAYMNEHGEVSLPTQPTCRLATELVKGMTWNFLPEDFVYKQVEALVLKGEDPVNVEELMLKMAGARWQRFDKALRGYRLE